MNSNLMNIDFSQFDSADYRRLRVAQTRGEFNWDASRVAAFSPEERAQWQQRFRERFAFLLGDLNGWERPDLAIRVLESSESAICRRETVAFTTRPGLRAIGHLLIPHNCTTPRPTIVCLPGHGRGAKSMIGLAENGVQRSANQHDEYDANFALQCVEHGYVTFALESFGFGWRRDEEARATSAEASSCNRDAMAALMVGETLPGWRVWDAMRAVDYLQTRPDVVDAQRVAMMGISGGGLVALFAAALDERVAACVVSGYFNTFAASVLSINHCSDNYVPGLLRLCEMPDLAALIAPRVLFCESGRDDPIFPLAAFEEAVQQARAIYEVFDAPTNFDAEIFSDAHKFHGVGAFAFLQNHL